MVGFPGTPVRVCVMVLLRTRKSEDGKEVLSTVFSRCFLSLKLFLSSGGGSDTSRWIVFIEGSSGGSGFGLSAANVGLTIAVTAMVGIALAATVFYSLW